MERRRRIGNYADAGYKGAMRTPHPDTMIDELPPRGARELEDTDRLNPTGPMISTERWCPEPVDLEKEI